MTRVNVKFTTKEIELLRSLVSDQLFRREFIDSRLPGSSSNTAELSLGKQLLARLRSVADRAARIAPDRNGAVARAAGVPPRKSGSAALKKPRAAAARSIRPGN